MSLDHVVLLLQEYKYFILFPIAVIEGPIITVIAGFLVVLKIFNPFAAYATVVVADLVGDSIWYAVGRFSGPLSRSLERFFGLTSEHIEEAKRKLETNPFKMTAMAKLIHGIGFAGLIAAGVVRMSYASFLAACFVVALGQTAVLLTVGLLFGRAYNSIAEYLDYFVITAASVGLCVIIFLILRFRQKKKS